MEDEAVENRGAEEKNNIFILKCLTMYFISSFSDFVFLNGRWNLSKHCRFKHSRKFAPSYSTIFTLNVAIAQPQGSFSTF
jgi:hypothetical protein